MSCNNKGNELVEVTKHV